MLDSWFTPIQSEDQTTWAYFAYIFDFIVSSSAFVLSCWVANVDGISVCVPNKEAEIRFWMRKLSYFIVISQVRFWIRNFIRLIIIRAEHRAVIPIAFELFNSPAIGIGTYRQSTPTYPCDGHTHNVQYTYNAMVVKDWSVIEMQWSKTIGKCVTSG